MIQRTPHHLLHYPDTAVLRTIWQGEDVYLLFAEPIDSFTLERDTSLQDLDAWVKDAQAIQDDYAPPHIAGFFSYEFLHRIESIPQNVSDNYSLPQAQLTRYRTVAVISENSTTFHSSKGENPRWKAPQNLLEECAQIIQHIARAQVRPIPSTALTEIARYSNFSPTRYADAVETIREMIRDGKVYQVNISQQIILPGFADPWEFFQELSATEQGVHSAYLSVGSDTSPAAIISNSPELFFSLENRSLKTAPIKGTAPRAALPDRDRAEAEGLLLSEKNRAELAMIVDLLRNDMGKICETGSIVVDEFPKLLSLRLIHHLYAPIQGKLRPDISFLDIIRALFPSGSVTGAPKFAAMQAIAAFEQTMRGPYCGAIGWIGRDSLSFNVAIRTGLVTPERCVFQAGGGVTIDSKGRDEYAETLQKAHAFFHTHQKLSETPLLT